MEANRKPLTEERLKQLEGFFYDKPLGLGLINEIRQQQAEIERLNRAYEVLKGALEQYTHFDEGLSLVVEEAQRIKEGGGEQG